MHQDKGFSLFELPRSCRFLRLGDGLFLRLHQRLVLAKRLGLLRPVLCCACLRSWDLCVGVHPLVGLSLHALCRWGC